MGSQSPKPQGGVRCPGLLYCHCYHCYCYYHFRPLCWVVVDTPRGEALPGSISKGGFVAGIRAHPGAATGVTTVVLGLRASRGVDSSHCKEPETHLVLLCSGTTSQGTHLCSPAGVGIWYHCRHWIGPLPGSCIIPRLPERPWLGFCHSHTHARQE